jgi:predicted Zn-ribbon and HTH transcriptional regulator
MRLTAMTLKLTVSDFRSFGFDRWASRYNVLTGWAQEVLTKDGKTFFVACETCAGSGYRPEYHHIEAGRCWKCSGYGVQGVRLS